MVRAIAVLACLVFAGPALAARCGNTSAGFDAWKVEFINQAPRKGVSRATAEKALSQVRYSRKVIALDRDQGSFKLPFNQFYAKRVGAYAVKLGRKHMRNNAKLLAGIERRYGVPGSLLVAVWGLESAFGRYMGSLPIVQSLATLSYDCRRSDFFTRELVAALKIIERGYMRQSEMVGAWAGEIGQTQFLAQRYLQAAVDYDGSGKADLMRSTPDVLASTANWFAKNGWRRGQPWGPGTANYRVIQKWNKAKVYQRTIAKFADELSVTQ